MLTDNSCNAEDKLLLLKIKEGNIDAFNALYEKHWEKVYSDSYKRLKDADCAKDITQDVFLQLWTRRQEADIQNLPAYLFIAVRNNAYKWMEKKNRFTPIPELLKELEISKDRADADILRKEFLRAYEALVASLTPSQQQIFKMRYSQDLSTQEISERLNISRKTVQNQLAKSVSLLRHSLMLLYLLFLMNLK